MVRWAIPVMLGACFAHGNMAVSLSAEKPFGFAWYDLEHFGPDTTFEGSKVRPMIRSELNFPLDPVRLNLGLESWREGRGPGTGLRTEVHAWASVGPAWFRMRDEDWMGASANRNATSSSALFKISDTRSKAEGRLFGGGFNRELGELGLFGIRWALGLGLDGSLYRYSILGYEGRQRSGDGENPWVEVSHTEDEEVLTYKTFSARAPVSIRSLSPLLGLGWEARLHPLYSRSEDDHVLRMKRVTMDCFGIGGALEASRPIGPLAPWVRMEMDQAWGKMKQTYYADSPDSPEDETGTSMRGISTSTGQWLISAGLRASFGKR